MLRGTRAIFTSDVARCATRTGRRALDELIQKLPERYGNAVLSVRLFGSRARGNADAASDVDVAVVLEKAGWRERVAVIDLATDVGLANDVLLSPTIFDRDTYERWERQERPLVMDIEREGILLWREPVC